MAERETGKAIQFSEAVPPIQHRDDKKPISSDRHPNPQPSCISISERHHFQQGGIFPSRFARRDSAGLNTNFPSTI